jgi:antirestriction protein
VIKIYIACLSSYNSGYLFGKWLDLSDYKNGDDVLEAIQEEILDNEENPMRKLYNEEPEEWAMHDIEGISYEQAGRTEWPDLDDLIEMNELLDEDETKAEALFGIKDHMGFHTLREASDFYDEKLIGEFSSEEDMATYIAEQVNCWDLSDGVGRYFDATQFARDLSCGGDVVEIGGTYFWAC